VRNVLIIVSASALCLSASAAAAQLIGGGLVGSMRGVGGYVGRTMGEVGAPENARAQGDDQAHRAHSHRPRAARRSHNAVAISRTDFTSEQRASGPDTAAPAPARAAGEQAAEAR
jgi:hypothetical protein